MAFQNIPIRRKLMTIILGTSGVVLLLTCAAFLAYEFLTFRQSSVQQISTLGEIVAANSTAALAYDNADDATEILGTLKAERHIVAACLYDRDGNIFSRYPSDASDGAFPPGPKEDGYRFAAGQLAGFAPVVQVKGGQRLGTLYLISDMDALYERLRLYGVIAVLVITASSLVAYILSRKLQHQISRPILALAETARAVSDRRDYSVRARKLGEDELGLLTDAFNHMLGQIEEKNTELEKRVRERTIELEAANQELDEFCQSVSHDLHTPLRAIGGFADILLDHHAGALPPAIRRYVDLIHKGADEMSQLIRDLLAFARLGRQPLSRETVDLTRLCREVFEDLQSEYRGRLVDLRLQPLPSASGDRALLRQVLVNLLSNAIKYTRPRDTAIIEVGVTLREGETAPVYFVRDNGVGFDMNYADKLFEVFQRLHHDHEFEGAGVGLATVRRIVERHGGRIWAEAAPESGAMFLFTLAEKAAPSKPPGHDA